MKYFLFEIGGFRVQCFLRSGAAEPIKKHWHFSVWHLVFFDYYCNFFFWSLEIVTFNMLHMHINLVIFSYTYILYCHAHLMKFDYNA